ncbi:MAG: hypothetical protein A2600_09370 [Candidatus Lambdaproteobacteria bacterium RIFOXYD1_FULL_56_27]|uniref:4-hydroxybenzoate polyprenyltransferase n=1 Tax=Candidatus Lambdaproteobacteria bacterium RIFOXYD2_FULL_56_26 TaxID=1817773 RepID=A0A1F6GUM0_9PROT|nr:MAG: hypothetical protein A2557_04640 [Candidatus Lambdaproteobacteria bacterium RIFOXYD2_FULL_56_26]OGH02261.1 MAG: hypothetical protein A2426_03120 [Candidatus Lambdaproteobacteria bacterium RIFOXYC1_FULL_56_13]OGH10030.1 MAG: hypothetical protein A2600_09370 [Candidatus Lambdaproteobacteria bacterium RIFOXYD1_FULL_56_27]
MAAGTAQGVVKFLELIKFSHTVFALPFALMGAVLGLAVAPPQSWREGGWMLLLVVVAMGGARTGAMGFNRLVDRHFDRKNPRTALRPSVTGEVSVPVMVGMIFASYAVLVLCAYLLNPLAFALSPVAIFLVSFYSYTKRFTAWCHLFLGLAIGTSPIAAWIAITGELALAPLVLGLSVMTWIAGFDILYALQDRDFDLQEGLSSIPARLGVTGALWVARLLHLGCIGLWFFLGLHLGLLWPYWLGAVAGAGMLLYEHGLIGKGDLSKVNLAFNLNGWISTTLFVALLGEKLLRLLAP